MNQNQTQPTTAFDFSVKAIGIIFYISALIAGYLSYFVLSASKGNTLNCLLSSLLFIIALASLFKSKISIK